MIARAFLAVSVLAFSVLSHRFAAAQEATKPSYAALLERLKKADPKLDFGALRLAYADTSLYNPYDNSRELQTAILKALGQQQYRQCLEQIDGALEKNYVNFNLHFAAYRCHTELKNPDRAKYHQYVFDGLIKSILNSGDGKAPASALVVISTEEEYNLLDVVGLKRTSQALVKENGHAYDLIVARDEKGKTLRLYFNIDRPYEWLSKNLEKGGK